MSELDVKAIFKRSIINIEHPYLDAPWRYMLGCEHDTIRVLLILFIVIFNLLFSFVLFVYLFINWKNLLLII